MLSRKNLLRILINSLLGVALVFIWSRFVNLNQLFQTLKTTNLKIALIFFIFFITSGLLRALRLKLLLKEFKVPLKELFFLNFLSQFLGFLVPLRLGELAKSVYLSNEYKLPFSKSLLWTLIDRFLDFLTILILITILLFIIPTNLAKSVQLIILVGLIGFILIIVFAVFNVNLLKKIMVFLSNIFIFSNIKKHFISLSHSIIDGLLILRRPPQELISLLIISTLAVLSDALMWLFTLYSVGVNLSFIKILLGSCLSSLTFLIPAAPGYVGSAEASGLAVFSGVLGVNTNLASAAIVLNHIFTIIGLPSLGITALYILKFNLKSVFAKLKRKD